jgi:hypothetical protein
MSNVPAIYRAARRTVTATLSIHYLGASEIALRNCVTHISGLV